MIGYSFGPLIFKCVLVGDPVVGKSCVAQRLAGQEFQPFYDITVGIDYTECMIEVQNRKIKYRFIDTVGQDNYNSIARTYSAGSVCAILVYDITNKKTFERMNFWLSEVKKTCIPDMTIALIGNKSDLSEKRQVQVEEGENFAKEKGLIFFETSAKTLFNVFQMINIVSTSVLEKIQNGKIPPSMVTEQNVVDLTKNQNPIENKKSAGCC
eukprot:c12755_g1_i1.p1 GENE.c12755_g1_i1~~c12755_g1_i1.p1  ORF type:complete len:210 (-),score=77.29 c12755_g1_i1:47-676(-)